MSDVCVCVFLQALGFGTGLTWGAIIIAWHPDNLTDRHGKYIESFNARAVTAELVRPAVGMGLILGAFTFGQCQFETYRNVRDPWNSVYSGAIVGFLVRFAFGRRVDKASFAAIGYGLGMGFADIAGALFDYNGFKAGIPELRQKTYEESDELRHLKELYPKYKDL